MYYLVIDLEMTGTEAGYHDIIQIGAVLADSEWRLVSEFESLVYPDNYNTHSTYATKIHGLELVDLRDAPLIHEVIENLEDWIRKSIKRPNAKSFNNIIICGQSILNDAKFLQYAYEKCKIKWNFAYKLIDLISFTYVMNYILKKNGYEYPKKSNLDSVAEYFDLRRQGDTHNALEDARLTYKVFKEYWFLAACLEIRKENSDG